MDDWKAVAIGLLITAGLRLLDYLAPKGHHLKIVKRYAMKDDEGTDDEG